MLDIFIYILLCLKKYNITDFYLIKKIITLYCLKNGYNITFPIDLDDVYYFVKSFNINAIVYDQLLISAIRKNNLDLVMILQKHINYSNIEHRAIFVAIENKYYNILIYLLKYSKKYEKFHSDIIGYAIITKDITTFEIFIKKYKQISEENKSLLNINNNMDMIKIINKYINK